MIFKGAGAHFCTGGNFVQRQRADLSSFRSAEFLALLQRQSRITADIRSLRVTKFGAVHGKLIGGGVAFALATDWCVCPAATTFNYGNLPRGVNPLFMFSRVLPLIVGYPAGF